MYLAVLGYSYVGFVAVSGQGYLFLGLGKLLFTEAFILAFWGK